MKKRLLILYLILIVFHNVNAQPGQVKFESLSVDDGFPSAHVYSFLRDTKGFMWFGTHEGLIRYDGSNYQVFYPGKNDPSQLYEGFVRYLFEDSKGRIWLSEGVGDPRNRKTIQVFDPSTEQFTLLNLHPTSNAWFANQYAAQNYFLEDEQGNIWVKCIRSGLYKIEEKSLNQFTVSNYKVSTDYPKDVQGDSVSVLFIDKKKNFWVGTKNGLYTFNRIEEKFIKFPDNDDGKADQVTGIVEDKQGKLWVNYERKGLHMIDPQTFQFLEKWPIPNPSLGNGNLRFLFLDRHENIWTIKQKDSTVFFSSLDRFNVSTGEVSKYFEDKPENTLAIHQIDHNGNFWVLMTYFTNWEEQPAALYLYNQNTDSLELFSELSPKTSYFEIDRYDNIWANDWDEGLLKFNQSNQKMTLLSDNKLSGQNSIIRDQDGKLLVASEAGVNRYTLNEAWQVTNEELILGQKVYNLFQDKSGLLWASVFNQDKVEMIGIDLNAKKIKNRFRLPSDLQGIRSIIEISDEELIIGTQNHGMIRYHKNYGDLTHFIHDNADTNSIASNSWNQLLPMDQKKIWVFNQNGVDIFDINQNSFVHIDDNITEKFGIIQDVCEYKKGRFWVAGAQGLSLYEPSKGITHKEYLFKEDFPTYGITKILDDEKGNLWLGTNNSGVIKFNIKEEKFVKYNETDGLPSNQVYAGLKQNNGALVFGGDEGLFIFHPEKLPVNQHLPNPVVTELRLFNEKVRVRVGEGILSKSIAYCNEVRLNHDQNILTFTYSALSFASPAKNQYAYFMEGIDKDWNYVGNQSFASYAGLSPGEYTFRVKASNNDGLWNEEGTSLQLTILPPWWQTGWAYAFYAMLGLSLLYSLRQYTVKRERLKHELSIQRMEAEKMHEVDQLKSHFFANISHEFRTPLTLLLGPLDKLMTEPAYAKEHALFSMMQRNAQRLLHLINQLLDLSKLEAGRMTLELRAQALLPFLKGLGMSFSSLAEHQQIEYHFQYSNSNPVLYFDADKLEKIIINLLSNAFKFTPAGGSVTFTARLHDAEKSVTTLVPKPQDASHLCLLELKVEDSGVGMSEEQLAQVFHRFYQAAPVHHTEQQGSGIGLSLVRELLELYGGEISAVSEPAQGSCFTVRLPLWEADFAEMVVGKATSANKQNHFDQVGVPYAVHEEFSETGAVSDEAPLVLVVEDNADVRAFIRGHLHPSYQVREAADGVHGYQQAIKHIPDLILSDVMMPSMQPPLGEMPGMDGVELCARLKADEKTAHIPVILLTAKASEGDRIEGLETGADDYIIKPFKADELLVRIKNLIESRRKLREQFSREVILQPSSVKVTSVDEKFLQRLMEIMEEHMADFTFGVEAFGHALGMSRVQLYRKIKALTNLSPGDYIREMRLKRAAELISLKAGSIGEVAFLTGFNDPSHFTKCFHKKFGQTPSEYMAKVDSR